MKKVLLILISLALFVSMTGAVSGEYFTGTPISISGEASGYSEDVEVKLVISDSYTVTIPANFKIDGEDEYTAGAPVSATVTRLGADESLMLSISSTQYDDNDEWRLKSNHESDEKQYYRYIIGVNTDANEHSFMHGRQDSPVKNNDIILTYTPGQDTGTMVKQIHILVLDKPTSAAEYTDSLKFTVTIGETSSTD